MWVGIIQSVKTLNGEGKGLKTLLEEDLGHKASNFLDPAFNGKEIKNGKQRENRYQL